MNSETRDGVVTPFFLFTLTTGDMSHRQFVWRILKVQALNSVCHVVHNCARCCRNTAQDFRLGRLHELTL